MISVQGSLRVEYIFHPPWKKTGEEANVEAIPDGYTTTGTDYLDHPTGRVEKFYWEGIDTVTLEHPIHGTITGTRTFNRAHQDPERVWDVNINDLKDVEIIDL